MALTTTGLLLVAFIGIKANDANRLEQVLQVWAQYQNSVRSLVVQFVLNKKDKAFSDNEQFTGTVHYLRTDKGEIYVAYDLMKAPQGLRLEQDRWTLLAYDGSFYVLHHAKRQAVRLEMRDGKLLSFIAQVDPLVLFLDQESARRKYDIAVNKQDNLYTYISFKPKPEKPSSNCALFNEGRIIVMNKASDTIPKNMPQELWYTNGTYEFTYSIDIWQLNGAQMPKREDFVKPQDRSGWMLLERPNF